MAQATDQLGASSAGDNRVIATVGAAHFVSHYHFLVLPPLFAFVRADYDVTYTELGFALVAYNIASAFLQTPAGFLVDRIGGRIPLFAALTVAGLAFAVVGLTDSFWLLVAMFGLAGIANAVYHPADYALLSHEVAAERIAKAYSFHTFAGLLGSAAAPASLLLMQGLWGWRGAFLGAAALGFAVALLIALQPRPAGAAQAGSRKDNANAVKVGWPLLLSAPILFNFATFMLLAMINAGLQNYSVVALGALYGTPAVIANAALTGYLGLATVGVLAGGVLAAWFQRHDMLTMAGLAVAGSVMVLIVTGDPGNVLLIAIMSAIGFLTGFIMPSRDLLVRQVTPPGAFGTVFGFVTTGFNIAGVVAPLAFGLLMDHGHPQLVFVSCAALCLLAVATIAAQPGKPAS